MKMQEMNVMQNGEREREYPLELDIDGRRMFLWSGKKSYIELINAKVDLCTFHQLAVVAFLEYHGLDHEA